MKFRKENANGGNVEWAPGTYALVFDGVEVVEVDFGEGAVERARWAFHEAEDESHRIAGWSPVKFTPNSKFMGYFCAVAGTPFDALPDELSTDALIGRRVLGKVEIAQSGRAKVVELFPEPAQKKVKASRSDEEVPF